MSGAPFLLIDAGNSRVKWAFVQADATQTHKGAFAHGGAQGNTGATAAHGGTHGDAGATAAGLASSSPPASQASPDWSGLPTPGSAWISNVAGAAAARRIETLIEAHWPGLPQTTIRAVAQQCGVTNGYASPMSLGSDRWAGLIGARAAFPGENLLIATFGTATTLEALRADGYFIGGLIAPGWSMMMRSLGEHTAQLPTLDPAATRTLLADTGTDADATSTLRTGPFFATDTHRSLSAGCVLAQAGLIERTLADLQDAWRVPVRLIVSGGAAGEIAGALKVPHTRHDTLVLSGLALIATAYASAAHEP